MTRLDWIFLYGALLIQVMPNLASAQNLVCEGYSEEGYLLKRVNVKVEERGTHLLALVPLTLRSNQSSDFEFYSSVPVGIGTIEVIERLGIAELTVAKGKLLVTDLHDSLITGVLIHQDRLYSLRLDKEDGQWEFLLYDTSQREAVSGKCR